MPRQVDPARRAGALEAAVDHALEQGVADLSLRPLAAAAGVSPYTLLAWFGGTKDSVTAAVVDAAQMRQQAALAEWFGDGGAADLPGVLRRYWEWACEPAHRVYLRHFFEVYGLALQQPDRFPGLLDGALAQWQRMARDLAVSAGVEPARASDLSTRTVALVFGLLLDLLTTDDLDRTTAALHREADALAQELAAGARSAR